MIKRTLYFGNPVFLRMHLNQIQIEYPLPKDRLLNEELPKVKTAAIEDLGMVVLDNPQITITHALMNALVENNVALLSCDSTHHPSGLMLTLCGNTLQNERFRDQVSIAEPLKKNLWAQVVNKKIRNQVAHLNFQNLNASPVIPFLKEVKSGDSTNIEGAVAAWYWKLLSPALGYKDTVFRRDRMGESPNYWLNYGYAILRAITARSIVAAGLLPTLGIHHRNKYNAFCLADDLMEPYRPFVDQLVCQLVSIYSRLDEIPKEVKVELLKIPAIDVQIDEETSPLMNAVQRTAYSLAKCYSGEQRKLLLPEF